ncbi:hypothetical protein LCGC14_2115540, partial [marine sediment metagenome]
MPHIPGHILPALPGTLPPLPDLGGGLEVGERLPIETPSEPPPDEYRRFLKYLRDRRGDLFRLMANTAEGNFRQNSFYNEWKRAGYPTTYTPLAVKPISPQDVARLGERGIDPGLLEAAGIPFAEETPQDRITTILEAGGAVDEALADLGVTAEVDPATGREGFWGPDGWFWEKDEFGEFQRTDFDPARRTQPLAAAPPTELTPFQQAQEERQRQEFQTTQQRLTQEREADRLFREQQFGFQREQLEAEQLFREQQLTGQREERLAQLAAQPISWLQHAALSGQTPVVQPWMIPLMRPGQNLQVGQPIPGFQPALPGGAVEQGGFIPGTATPSPLGTQFANLPELRRPSAQLFARMGPTAQQQFLGFRQARTGIPP